MKKFLKKYKKPFFLFYINQRNYFSKGYSEFAFFKGVFEFIIVAGLGLKFLFKVEIPYWLMIVVGIFVILFLWGVGKFWDKLHLFHIEKEWHNKRDPFVKFMKKRKI